MRTAAAAILLLISVAPAFAQVDGHVSVIVDALPDIDPASGAQPVGELRVRIFVERRDEIGSHLRINLSGYVDGLLADRTNVFRLKAEATNSPGGPKAEATSSPGGSKAEATNAGSVRLEADPTSHARDVIVRPADLYVDFVTSRFDVRAGAARLVWGRLDEFQPTDVVNPIDLSRFLMEGRSEARLPVGLIRGRVFLPNSTTVEAVVVPVFRRGRFDQLEEESSPFNLALADGTPERGALQGVPRVRDEPGSGTDSLQGGVRLTATTDRVDWAVSAYRGIRAFPISTLTAPDPQSFVIRESFPRFTMIGADFETVRGRWGVRGEIAAFVDDELQSIRAARGVPGHSVTAGVGVDRRAGDYRIAANALWSSSGVDEDDPSAAAFAGDEEVQRSDVSLVVAADRSFARETRTLRVFGVYDPAERTTFTRVIAAVSVRDNVWLEGSGGIFAGRSLDVIGRLTHRDFAYARLKVFF